MKLTQQLKPAYFTDVEEQLHVIFYDLIFAPIMEIVKATTAQMSAIRKDFWNSADNVICAALRKGRIQYADGVFSGSFSAEISKALRVIGAAFDSRSNTYKIDPMKVPGSVKAEAASYQENARHAHEEITRQLGYMQDTLDDLVNRTEVKFDKGLKYIEHDFKSIAKEISVAPQLGEDGRSRLLARYNDNMKLWIKNFSEESIHKLRGVVQENAQEGFRFDQLIDRIKNRYGVAQNKAKFLARQETSLFMSKFREERFLEAGFPEYIWRSSHDARVRDDHKKLDGRVFRYDNPPIVDHATGNRANPGEDFSCRCVAVPYLGKAAEAIR